MLDKTTDGRAQTSVKLGWTGNPLHPHHLARVSANALDGGGHSDRRQRHRGRSLLDEGRVLLAPAHGGRSDHLVRVRDADRALPRGRHRVRPRGAPAQRDSRGRAAKPSGRPSLLARRDNAGRDRACGAVPACREDHRQSDLQTPDQSRRAVLQDLAGRPCQDRRRRAWSLLIVFALSGEQIVL